MEAAVEACRRSGRVTGAECLFLRGCPFVWHSCIPWCVSTVYGETSSTRRPTREMRSPTRPQAERWICHRYKCSAARQPLRSHHHLQSGQIISTSRTYFWRLFSEPLNCAVGIRTKFRVPARRETGCTCATTPSRCFRSRCSAISFGSKTWSIRKSDDRRVSFYSYFTAERASPSLTRG